MVQRRLEDLWVRGAFMDFDDGKGDPVRVWLQKLSPTETASALRRANAARARVKSVKADPDSDEYMDLWSEVQAWETREELVEYLLAEPQARIEERVEAELASEDEWADEGYVQGLRDAWDPAAQAAHLLEPESPEGIEASRVLAELTRFNEAAKAIAAPEVAQARAQLMDLPMDELQDRAFERIIRYRASSAWLTEMHLCEIFYGTHDAVPDAKRADKWVAARGRYWTKREDFDRVPNEVLGPLLAKYAELSVDVIEGKDSEETPTSLPSSGPPPAPATGISSGLVDAVL